MADFAGIVSGFVHHLVSRSAGLCALAALSVSAPSASAQNLVQDPDFVDGLEYYQDNNDATPTTMANGMTGVDLGPNGLVEQYPLTSAYTAGTTYIFTFMAAALNSDDPTTLIASFGPNCTGDCEEAVFQQTTSNTALTQYSFTSTAQDQASDSFLYVETAGDGSAFRHRAGPGGRSRSDSGRWRSVPWRITRRVGLPSDTAQAIHLSSLAHLTPRTGALGTRQ